MTRRWLLIIALVVVAAGLAYALGTFVGFSQTKPRSVEEMTKSDERGEVAVSVAFLNPTDPRTYPPGELVLGVGLDTHVVALEKYDVAGSAVLTNDRGERPTGSLAWVPESEGSHHRVGFLRVKNRAASGRPLWDSRTKSLQLELRNLAGVPSRTFRWQF